MTKSYSKITKTKLKWKYKNILQIKNEIITIILFKYQTLYNQTFFFFPME